MTPAAPKPRAGEHVLKVAGEVQMKVLSHDMGLIRRENERLIAERDLLRERERELVEALGNAEALRPRLLKDFGYVPEYVLDFCNRARALAKHGR